MKIVVMNFSGNVGKTTISEHVLKANMENASVFSVESINQGSTNIEAEQIKGKKYGELIDQLMMIEDAIIDVGASNVEDFLKYMDQFSGSHEDFDYFVVPTTKEKKVQQDTINTIHALNVIGVPKNKIRLVFNMIETDETVKSEFPSLIGFNIAEDIFVLNENCTIYLNEIFERLITLGKSLGDINNDETDYRSLLSEAKPKEKHLHIQMIALKRLAITANKNLNTVYKNLFI